MTEPASVHQWQPAGKMTVADYRREREELRIRYGASQKEAGAKADQALVALFLRSKWSQVELAREEHHSETWISQHLQFGGFLAQFAMANLPRNLTERKFRKYWLSVPVDVRKNERQGFQAVLKLMEAEFTLSKSHQTHKPVGEAIKATCADGGWHKLTTIVSKVQCVEQEATQDQIMAVLKGMIAHGWYNVFCEKHKGGDLYRIVLGGHQKIDLVTLKQELGPIINGLRAEGKKNMATMSPGTVARLTCQLEEAIDRLIRGGSPQVDEQE
jgi:hypothetical protein